MGDHEMAADNSVLSITYKNSGEENQVILADLQAALTGFLEHLGVRPLIDQPFFGFILYAS